MPAEFSQISASRLNPMELEKYNFFNTLPWEINGYVHLQEVLKLILALLEQNECACIQAYR